jgi:hypothetical protein
MLSEPYKLWAIKEPWHDRPRDTAGGVFRAIGLKTGGDALRSVANGWAPPPQSHFQDLERKATILGGLMTLQALDEEPWASLDLAKIPALKLRNDRSAQALLLAVSTGAKLEGKRPPANIKDASSFMRQRVIASQAGGPAWYGRAMHLTLAGTGATGKRANVEGAVATGTSLAAKAMHATTAAASATIIGLPVAAVTGAVGGILEGVSLGMTALSGRSKVEKARAQGEAQGFAQKFEHSLDKRALRQQKQLLDRQIKAAEAQQAQEEEEARIQGERITKFITAAVWVGVIGGTGLLTYTAVQAIRRRRAA